MTLEQLQSVLQHLIIKERQVFNYLDYHHDISNTCYTEGKIEAYREIIALLQEESQQSCNS